MTDLLNLLRDEAVTLGESLLPSSDEVRPIVGALVNRLERLEKQVVGELVPAPVTETVTQPSVTHAAAVTAPAPAPAPTPSAPPDVPAPVAEPSTALQEARRELAAAQARVAALTEQYG